MIKIFKPKKPISFELDDHELQQKEQVKDYKKSKGNNHVYKML